MNNMTIDEYDLQELVDEVTNADYDDCIRKAYGGRGMMDSTCLGLVFESESQWTEFVIGLCQYVADPDRDNTYDFNDVRKVVSRARTDNMGRGVIVYWPYGGLALSEDE